MEIDIPYNWKPRNYQKPLWNALNNEGFKRAVYVWHRRCGKDLIALQHLICQAVLNKNTHYWHIFPFFSQGKKAIFEQSTSERINYIDMFPPNFIKSINASECKIELINGSTYRVIGSNDPKNLKGSGINGVVFSEYAACKPNVWEESIEPQIFEKDGWALFNFTPRGKNHAYDLWEMALKDDEWFTEILTVDDTKGEAISEKFLQKKKETILASGKTIDFFNQEYYCSFNSAVEGAYYSEQMNAAEKDGRITRMPYESNLLVSTWWDLGVNDTTAIWFTQQVGNEIRLIDFIEDSGKGLDHYIKLIKEKPYVYESHNAPHDIAVREFTSGKARIDIAYDLGIQFDIVPNIPVQDGINAVRSIFNRCIFDEKNCKQGLLALRNYKKQFDELKNTFKIKPLHDWSSNAADAFRYLAVGITERKPKVYQHEYAIM